MYLELDQYFVTVDTIFTNAGDRSAQPAITKLENGLDTSMPIKTLVLMVFVEDQIKGYPHRNFVGTGLVNDRFVDQALVVFFIEEGRFAFAYSSQLGDQELRFDLVISDKGVHQLQDRETSTLWNLKGEAIAGPLVGEQLGPMISANAMWFSFRVSVPDAAIFQPTGSKGFELFEK